MGTSASPLRTIVLSAGVLLAGALPGCERSLFVDSDNAVSYKLDRYYDGDSAVKTTESRKKASDMGFGVPFPGGGGGGGSSNY